jgi:hypothetical protein
LQFSGIVLKALIEERGLIGLIRFKDCIIWFFYWFSYV